MDLSAGRATQPAAATLGNGTWATRQTVSGGNRYGRLAAARVNVRLGQDWIRLAPSVYNDMADLDRFLEALL